MTDHPPNWQTICASEIWQQEILPMLDSMIERSRNGLECAELKDVKLWQGRISALKVFRDTPQNELDFLKVENRELARQGLIPAVEETDDNGPGRNTRPFWAKRWGRRTGV